MSDSPATPLLQPDDDNPEQSRSRSAETARSTRLSDRKPSLRSAHSDESTPLLSRVDDGPYRDNSLDEEDASSTIARSLDSSQDRTTKTQKKSRWRWPIIAALGTLVLVVIIILGLGFATPAAVEEYARQAAVFEPTDLSIETFTASGVQARIKGDFKLDSSRVNKKSIRDLGRFGTWIAAAVETKPTVVEVSLPEYGNVMIGTAEIPKIVISTIDGRVTPIDLLTDVRPGEIDGLRHVAMDWIEGRLGQIRLQGKADVGIKSGIFSLGTQRLVETLMFQGNDIPSVPSYQIEKINVHEVDFPDGGKGMSADVSISAFNDYPLAFEVPPLAFDIMIAGCSETEPFIKLANATTKRIEVVPRQNVRADAEGVVRQLSKTLLVHCPGSKVSPLDALLGGYINGDETTVFVRGADLPGQTPDWISELTKSVTVPVPFSGRSMGKLIRNFTMDDVHVGMPNPLADPDSRAAQPSVSATVNVMVNLPEEMNFPIDVTRVRSKPDVFFKDQKLGVLDLDEWHAAKARRVDEDDEKPGLLIKTKLKDTPIWITDRDVFSSVIQKMLFGGKVRLDIKAAVDIEVKTAIGKFVIRDIPAAGSVPVQPLPKSGDLSGNMPKAGDLNIIETTPTSLLLEIRANVTNPTNYSASVPYVNIEVGCNDTILGQAYGQGIEIHPGANDNLALRVNWSPRRFSGEAGIAQARELMSQYLSNYNTTLFFRTHRGTFPSNPLLGSALSGFKIEVATPRLGSPHKPDNPGDGDDDDNHGRFVQDATMHLLSSTANFRLNSPLQHTTVFVTHLNVTAFYNHTEPVGQILYDLPIAVPPGLTETPRLPVDWTLDSVGYDAVKDALGGTLKLDSSAQVGLAIGEFNTRVWYEGGGIGARVQL